MKKILLPLDPVNIDREAIEFACYLSKMANTHVTGVFLETNQVSVVPETHAIATEAEGNTMQESLLIQATSRFINACVCRDTRYLLHKKNCITIKELIAESRFSDLIVLPPGLSLDAKRATAPSSLVRYILSHSECPVVLAPEDFDIMDEIVFTYNGSKASVFAIKQFTYLFPKLRKCKVVILAVNTADHVLSVGSLMEWVESHYREAEYVCQQGEAADELMGYLLSHSNSFVVMGAYGRNAFSRLVKRSVADPLAGTLFNPIFITH